MRMCWNPVAVRVWRGYFGRVLKVYDEKAQIKINEPQEDAIIDEGVG